LPSDVDVPRPSAISSFVKERILLVTCNTCLPPSNKMVEKWQYVNTLNDEISRVRMDLPKKIRHAELDNGWA
ncbi:hypothetical protein COCMIDRAFT_106420, partial [Bipolaris oryzae ATCC 44560]